MTAEEKACMQKRKGREMLFKGEDKLQAKHVWSALRDPLVYLTAVALFSSSLPLLSFGTFLPSIILGLGLVQSPHPCQVLGLTHS